MLTVFSLPPYFQFSSPICFLFSVFAKRKKKKLFQLAERASLYEEVALGAKAVKSGHRVTVVGNPGGSLSLWPNYFVGGTWGCQKI
jgi:hypothetical protein